MGARWDIPNATDGQLVVTTAAHGHQATTRATQTSRARVVESTRTEHLATLAAPPRIVCRVARGVWRAAAITTSGRESPTRGVLASSVRPSADAPSGIAPARSGDPRDIVHDRGIRHAHPHLPRVDDGHRVPRVLRGRPCERPHQRSSLRFARRLPLHPSLLGVPAMNRVRRRNEPRSTVEFTGRGFHPGDPLRDHGDAAVPMFSGSSW